LSPLLKVMINLANFGHTRGLFLTSPLGAKFGPRGKVVPQGLILSPGDEILCSPLHSSK
jgi:hypothetical protein